MNMMKSAPASPKMQFALPLLCAVMFFDAMGVGLILPVMPQLILDLSGLPVSRAAEIGGYLLFVFAGMQFLFTPLLGAASDRFGRRPVILIAVLGYSADYFIMALAPTLLWLFLARFLSGVCGATYAAAAAGIVDMTRAQDHARNFGLIGASIGAGLIFGPALGGILGEENARLPFYVAGALTLALAVAAYFLLPETLKPENRRAFSWARANPLGSLLSVAQSRAAIAFLIALFCLQLASQSYNSIWAFFTIEVADWSPRTIGISVAVYGFLMAIVQGALTGPVVARMGELRAGLFSMFVGVIVYVGLAFARDAAALYLWVMAGSLSGFAFPVLQSLLSKTAADNAQGEMQGVISASYSLTAVVGPIVMTQLFSAFTNGALVHFPGAPFILAAFLIILCLFFFGIAAAPTSKAP